MNRRLIRWSLVPPRVSEIRWSWLIRWSILLRHVTYKLKQKEIVSHDINSGFWWVYKVFTSNGLAKILNGCFNWIITLAHAHTHVQTHIHTHTSPHSVYTRHHVTLFCHVSSRHIEIIFFFLKIRNSFK